MTAKISNEEFQTVADKFNDDIIPYPGTVGELIEKLELLPKETQIVFWYTYMYAHVDDETGKQTLLISDP